MPELLNLLENGLLRFVSLTVTKVRYDTWSVTFYNPDKL